MHSVKKHNKNYENVHPAVFERIGMAEILGKSLDVAVSTKERRFIANFGVKPQTCSEIWRSCLQSSHHIFNGSVHDCCDRQKWEFDPQQPIYKPEHLLWPLNFLKCYNKEDENSCKFGADEKTARKWIWIFVEAIAFLKNEVVSLVCSI